MTSEKPARPIEPRNSDDRFQRLIEQARSGDRLATGELISDYRNYLLLIANEQFDRNLQAKLGPSDVVQQTLMAAQEKVAQFQGESEAEFRGWIRQILKNDLLDIHRKFKGTRRRQVNVETRLDDSKLVTPEPVDRCNTPQADALLNEQAEQLRLSMAQLSEQHQLVLQLRNWQEMSFIEIGERLHCSADAARKLWFRAVLKLQETFHRLNPGMKSSLLQTLTSDSDRDES